MMRTKVLVVAAAGVVAFLAVGCGDDGDDGSGGLEATASEFQFEPDDWTVDAGEFDLEFTNDGSVDHEWVIMNEPIASEEEFTPNTVQTEDQRTSLVFEIRIRVDDPDVLRAGMPADVAFG